MLENSLAHVSVYSTNPTQFFVHFLPLLAPLTSLALHPSDNHLFAGRIFLSCLRDPTVAGSLPQGDRILSCPGEYRQQVVFVETTEKSFPSQTHLMCMLLPQQIECNVPHRSYICRGMVLPNAAAIFVEGHI
jgi:hypothetical protein